MRRLNATTSGLFGRSGSFDKDTKNEIYSYFGLT